MVLSTVADPVGDVAIDEGIAGAPAGAGGPRLATMSTCPAPVDDATLEPMGEHRLSAAEIDALWAAWSPAEVARRLANVTVPWCITAGWALELFTDAAHRVHCDIEIAVPADQFAPIADALPGFEWDVVGDGHVWPFPRGHTAHFQTWLREPSTGAYRLDVFREPTIAGRWACRRDVSITLPYDELILRNEDGIPYVIPEVALLFKAKHLRPKDRADFRHVLPALDISRRSRLRLWLTRVHPGHPWITELDAPT